MILGKVRPKSLCGILLVAMITSGYTLGQSGSAPVDPGVRGGAAGAGGPLMGLTPDETAFFLDGQTRFAEIEVVNKGANNGLGPRFNSNQCFSCHSQPNAGGTSPAKNPLPEVAALDGAKNAVPWFIVPDGPIREARFQQSNGTADGSVHDLFVITGRADAPGCNIAQFDFLPAGNPLTGQGGNRNIIFRIPTPVFGAGLIEGISDSAILANMQANASAKSELGIHGHANAHLSGNVNLSATMELSPASGGRRRTNPFSCSRARPTTLRWESQTSCSRRSATKLPAVSSFPLPTTPLTSQPLPRPKSIRTAFRTPPSFRTLKRFPTLCGCSLHPRPLHPHRPAKRDATCLQKLDVCTAIHRRLPLEQ